MVWSFHKRPTLLQTYMNIGLIFVEIYWRQTDKQRNILTDKQSWKHNLPAEVITTIAWVSVNQLYIRHRCQPSWFLQLKENVIIASQDSIKLATDVSYAYLFALKYLCSSTSLSRSSYVISTHMCALRTYFYNIGGKAECECFHRCF